MDSIRRNRIRTLNFHGLPAKKLIGCRHNKSLQMGDLIGMPTMKWHGIVGALEGGIGPSSVGFAAVK
jgi:hypothetical protein